ncbi:MAG: hypothetical protein P1V20_02945 [Verrucomicrobiales bacterium]|nr:hypothetical protein [Verrucomicrobiales bacterium]
MYHFFKTIFVVCLVTGLIGAAALAQDEQHLALDSPLASFVEDDFPFFTQTLDCRKLEGDWPEENLTQRGIILKPGDDYYVAFDIDLLRVALVWKSNEKGEFLTMSGMAPGSYRLPNKKASAGQNSLPVPLGTPVAANGLYPGWGEKVDKRDRKWAGDDENGLGPAPGLKWKGLEVGKGAVKLKYSVGGTDVEEMWLGPRRMIKVAPGKEDLVVNLASTTSLTIPASDSDRWIVHNYDGSEAGDVKKLWAEQERKIGQPCFGEKPVLIETGFKQNPEVENGFQIEEMALPMENPWQRNVRLSAFGFFKNGDAAISTFDGDVWIVNNLNFGDGGNESATTWSRFASGLHEPIGLEIVDDEIYVFSRNGIIRLLDTNNDGEADFYENFSNVFPQTAETREFANDIVAKPGGGFYLAKGGQQGTTTGIANGTVVEVSADGQSYEIICTGLRMPYIGVDPQTGIITASDQQGNWKPATPVRIIKKGEYYGFQPSRFKDKAVHPAPTVEPQIWIPHFVNQSGASQVWLRDSKMGPLDDSLIHVGYNRPEIFKIYFDKDGDEVIQGAVASITHKFASGLLKGKVHPVDGSLWLTGFKIWGTSAEQISGLYRVTPTGEPVWVPAELRSEKRGVLLSFHQEVDPAIAGNLTSYSVDRWNYKRTHNYGSGHYQLNGEPGQESLPVSSVKISEDKKSVFVGIPDMKTSHSLRVTYKVPTADQLSVANAFFTVHQLRSIDLKEAGFSDDKVDLELSEEMLSQVQNIEPTVAIGKETSTKYGCIVCHAAGENVPVATATPGTQVAVGPPWNGLWKSKRNFSDGTELKRVDEVYLRESILDPARKVAEGFETEKTGVGMPSYLGVLKDHEIDSVILYIKSLQKVKPKKG